MSKEHVFFGKFLIKEHVFFGKFLIKEKDGTGEYTVSTAPLSDKEKDALAGIVRCRDCKSMHRVRSWAGTDEDECWLHASPETGALGKVLTDPDGFCAWGERKDGVDG